MASKPKTEDNVSRPLTENKRRKYPEIQALPVEDLVESIKDNEASLVNCPYSEENLRNTLNFIRFLRNIIRRKNPEHPAATSPPQPVFPLNVYKNLSPQWKAELVALGYPENHTDA